jgi:hypothetical protein
MKLLVSGCVALCLAAMLSFPLALADESALVEGPDPWPREITAENGDRLVIHQPQVDRWADDVLEARTAVALHLSGEEDPIYGALRVRGDTRTNLDTRLVTVANVRILEARFPSTGALTQAAVLARLRSVFPTGPTDIELDRLLENVERTQLQSRIPATELGPTVPEVIVAHEASRLVLIDGEPVLHVIPTTALMHVVNTKWHILLETATGTYFLRLGDGWLMSSDLASVAWRRATRPPRDLDRIPADHPRAEARDTPVNPSTGAPRIYVRTEPAELVVVEGATELSPIAGTSLLYVINTRSDLFFHLRDSRYYLLAAGRWFRAQRLEGPWAEVEEALPEDFARIPRTHAKATVRVSIPGTPEAEEAVIVAGIPRRSVIRRTEASVTVTYDGTPRFARCSGSQVAYAVNTSYDVVRVDTRYYCCHQGVWFAAVSALGPWTVCDDVPRVIYTIGPRCPVYRVTFVYVYEATPELVVVGYLPGYLGLYVSPRRRVVVFGTGWRYRPWVHAGVWYGWPLSFGIGVSYHPYLSGFVFGASYYSPYVVRPLRSTWYPLTAQYHVRYRTTNVYARWGSRVIHGHATWLRRQHVTGARGTVGGFGARPPPTIRRTRPSTRSTPRPRSDLYAGPDGRVYRRNSGGWQRLDGRTWRSVPTPPRTPTTQPRTRTTQPRTRTTPVRPPGKAGPRTTPPRATPPKAVRPRPRLPSRLERDARARQIGTERVRQLDRWRRTAPSIRQPVRPKKQPRVTQPRRRAPDPPSSGRKRRR